MAHHRAEARTHCIPILILPREVLTRIRHPDTHGQLDHDRYQDAFGLGQGQACSSSRVVSLLEVSADLSVTKALRLPLETGEGT